MSTGGSSDGGSGNGASSSSTSSSSSSSASSDSYNWWLPGSDGSSSSSSSFRTGLAIKWIVIGIILLAILAFFVGGLLHAQRRMRRKGKPPLGYHRFLVPHRQLEAFYAAHPHLPESQAYFERMRRVHAHNASSVPPYGHGPPTSEHAHHAAGYPMAPYAHGPVDARAEAMLGLPPPPAYFPGDRLPAYSPRCEADETKSRVHADGSSRGGSRNSDGASSSSSSSSSSGAATAAAAAAAGPSSTTATAARSTEQDPQDGPTGTVSAAERV